MSSTHLRHTVVAASAGVLLLFVYRSVAFVAPLSVSPAPRSSSSAFGQVGCKNAQLLQFSGGVTRKTPPLLYRLSGVRVSSTTSLSASGGGGSSGGDRESFSWDEGVLDKNVKDMLVDRAICTLRHYWSETGGDLYCQWLDRFDARQDLGDEVITTMGWARFLFKMMTEEPVEAVVMRTAMKDSKQVEDARRKNSDRPATLSPWRHAVNQLAADWDAEEEEEMKVALDYPPQLKAVQKGVVMQPVDIAKKVMAIREQLALEWADDLANIETENEEIGRLESERARVGDEEAERGRRLTYDHGHAFGGNSSPYRAENYEALLDYATEIGALAVQERMRVNGDDMGWQWMEQYLYWAKANSQSGSAGAGGVETITPPISPTASSPQTGGKGSGIGGPIGDERGARGREVGAVFGDSDGGIEATEEEKKMRGNHMLGSMMMGQKVQMFDPDKDEIVGVDPSEVSKSVMAARLGVAERIRVVLDTVPGDHGLVLRKYLEGRWESSPMDDGEEGEKRGER